jgi:hypothetical protein
MSRDTFDNFQDPDRGLFGDNELAEQSKPRRRGQVTGASDLHDLTLIFRFEKPTAIAVTDAARPKLNNSEWIWLPKSQIEFAHGKGGTVIVTILEWLAVEKGLL